MIIGYFGDSWEASVPRNQPGRGWQHVRHRAVDWLVSWVVAGRIDFILKQWKAYEGIWFGEWHGMLEILKSFLGTGLYGQDGGRRWVWLIWLECHPVNERSWVWFPVRVHTWIAGSAPSRVVCERQLSHWCFSLFPSSSISGINKYILRWGLKIILKVPGLGEWGDLIIQGSKTLKQNSFKICWPTAE